MKATSLLCLLCAAMALAVEPAAAQPTVGGILNNYSYTLPGLPNYGIAQGSIFALYGSNMSGSSIGLQNAPLQRTLGGTTLNVTVNGVTTHPPLYYMYPTQAAGILPSNTPVGTGTITVTYGGQTSAAFPIQVVASAFGMLSLNNLGSGPSAALDVNYRLLSFTNAANPNDYITFWGSGLGPVSGDETIYPQPQTDMTSLPIEVDIGGVPSKVAYRGRSQYPGLDEVVAQVPAGVSGCQVSVAIISGSPNVVSNFGTIPVATSGRTCTDPATSILTASQLQTLAGKSTVSYGYVSIGKTTSTTLPVTYEGITISPGGTTTRDNASAAFFRYTAAQFQNATTTTSSMGSCTLYTYAVSSGVSNPSLPTYLNAGPAVNINGPQGKQALTLSSGLYSNSALTSFIPTSGGLFTFDNGSGGPDVGAFNTSLTLAAPLVWTNMSSLTSVTRSKGVTVTWTGGNSNTYAMISGSAFAGLTTDTAVGGAFYCTAPVSAGTFTVPAAVLLSLPATGTVSGFPMPGSLSVGNYSSPQQFTASGLDFAFAQFSNANTTQLTYQ